MDEVPKKFWREWLSAYQKGDEDAMLKKVAGQLPVKTSGKAWDIIDSRQKSEMLNSYYMDLADYINEAYIIPLMQAKKNPHHFAPLGKLYSHKKWRGEKKVE